MARLHLGVSLRGIGDHPSAGRDPGVQLDGAIDVLHSISVARTAERGLFDFVFLADQSALNFNDEPKGAFGRNQEGCCEFEPITLLAALSQATTNLGLIATASTTFHQPYQLARQFLSLDHLSRGRAGWNVVTSSRNAEAQNFGSDTIIAKDQRYRRAREAVETVFGLWECWEPDAFVRDRQRGLFFDPQKMHRLEHRGEHFNVRGPLTMPRSPQGRPVIAQAGASADGTEFAASVADIIYAVQTTFDEASSFYARTKERVRANGRDPDHVKVLPGLLPVVGGTIEEAQRKYRQMLSYLDPILGLERLSRRGTILTGHCPNCAPTCRSSAAPASTCVWRASRTGRFAGSMRKPSSATGIMSSSERRRPSPTRWSTGFRTVRPMASTSCQRSCRNRSTNSSITSFPNFNVAACSALNMSPTRCAAISACPMCLRPTAERPREHS